MATASPSRGPPTHGIRCTRFEWADSGSSRNGDSEGGPSRACATLVRHCGGTEGRTPPRDRSRMTGDPRRPSCRGYGAARRSCDSRAASSSGSRRRTAVPIRGRVRSRPGATGPAAAICLRRNTLTIPRLPALFGSGLQHNTRCPCRSFYAAMPAGDDVMGDGAEIHRALLPDFASSRSADA